MDSRTHVEYAKRILPQGKSAMAVASLFPQIDRIPATLHRNFAHFLIKARPLVELGLQIAKTETTETTGYAAQRFIDECPRILSYFPGFALPEKLSNEDFECGLLAFVSHLHLDTFNQPVQAFTPFRAVCSGQWELWDRIGDFRYALYVEGVVESLREEWLKSKLWQDQFPVMDLTVAMVRRLADLSNRELSSEFSARTVETLGLSWREGANPAVEWLCELENELSDLHIKYLCS